MLRQYRPELKEERINEMVAEYLIYSKKWEIETKEELKGRGIKFITKNYLNNEQKNIYHCTDLAFKKLCEKYDIDQKIYFD